jgi:hypothetical protein
MNIVFSERYGRPDLNDYPFINTSLVYDTDAYYIGGMYAGPSDLTFRVPLKYFLAKYDDDLNRIWYREFGGQHSYIIRGIRPLGDGRCLVYGSRVDTTDGLRYPYILIVDENGEITSTIDSKPAEANLLDVSRDIGDILTMDVHEPLKDFRFYSVDGKLLMHVQDLLPGRHEMNVTSFASGVYVYHAISDQRQYQSGKLVKQ